MLKKLIAVIFFITGCNLINVDYYKDFNDPEYNYEMFWEELNDYYGLIELKNRSYLNSEFGGWDELYKHHKQYINRGMSNRELFSVLSSVLFRLRDSHSYWLPSRAPDYYWELPNEDDFPHPPYIDWASDPSELDPAMSYGHGAYFKELRIPSGYLSEGLYFGEDLIYAGIIDFAKVAENSPIDLTDFNSDNKLGYIYIASFIQSENNKDLSSAQTWSKDIDNVIEFLGNIDGLIIDVRQNSGGFEGNLERILNRFISKDRLLYYSYTRNGPNKSDFRRESYYGSPSDIGYRGPIVVLVDNGTSSCGDIFAMVMKTEDHSILVGQNTRGIMGKVIARELPIGWSFRMSSGFTLGADGNNYEEIGIEPNIVIPPSVVISKYSNYNGYFYYDPIFCDSTLILQDLIEELK